jgi:hypothetical protein
MNYREKEHQRQEEAMRDWNVVVTVREGGFTPALRLLETFGPVQKTDFFNTLVMRAQDPLWLLSELHGAITAEARRWISRFMPVEARFVFQSVPQFELRAREIAMGWLPRLAHARFHVRMHRRGFKGKLSSMEEERFLDEALLQHLVEAGTPGMISFDDPDAVIVVETVGAECGMSFFGRDQLNRFPLLHLD